MNGLSDQLLDAVDRLSEKFGPAVRLIDGVVDRLVPHTTVRASCPPGAICGAHCGNCCARCSGDSFSWIYYVYPDYTGSCGNPTVCIDCFYC